MTKKELVVAYNEAQMNGDKEEMKRIVRILKGEEQLFTHAQVDLFPAVKRR